MKEYASNSGSFVFKPRARLIKTIGEELISNDNVAITELVKNSYDAGSSIVEISFIGETKEKEYSVRKGKKTIVSKEKYIVSQGSSIVIFDQGVGMDFETIQKAWMEPATNYKKKSVNKNIFKRKFSGEKGIGRFAAAKLSKKLELITRQEGKEEIVVRINWNDFSNEESYLEDVKIEWIIRSPQEIKRSGTILRLVDLNEDWNESKIADLRIALSRLLNPIVPTEDFIISVNLPYTMGDSLAGMIERPETLNRPNYYIKGRVSNEGAPVNVVFYSKKKGQEENLSLHDFSLDNNKSYCVGPFSFEFKIWDRDDESINALTTEISSETNSIVRNVRDDLNDLCGISIYRDNIRVLPYGNKNNDWVRLDLRRVQNPTMRLSNNQIVGYISIGLESNPLLKDQSNREGIVEGKAFEDLKQYILLILNVVEQRRYIERPRENQAEKNKRVSLFETLSLETLSDKIKEDKPNQMELLNLISQKDAEIKETVVKIKEIISRYRRLTTLGSLIDPIIHDGNNYLHKIDMKSTIILNETKKENKDICKIAEKAEEIQSVRNNFAQLFKRIEPFGGRKRGRPHTFVLEDLIRNQFLLNREDLYKYQISYEITDTRHDVTIDESDLSIVLMNLIQNSIYWLSTKEVERNILVEVEDEHDGLAIIVSDNGPGVKSGIEEYIFSPYYSTKPEGVGLGLAIAGEIMSEYDGELSLLKDSKLGGASFKLLFKKRI